MDGYSRFKLATDSHPNPATRKTMVRLPGAALRREAAIPNTKNWGAVVGKTLKAAISCDVAGRGYFDHVWCFDYDLSTARRARAICFPFTQTMAMLS